MRRPAGQKYDTKGYTENYEITDDFFRHGSAGSVAADGLPPLLLKGACMGGRGVAISSRGSAWLPVTDAPRENRPSRLTAMIRKESKAVRHG